MKYFAVVSSPYHLELLVRNRKFAGTYIIGPAYLSARIEEMKVFGFIPIIKEGRGANYMDGKYLYAKIDAIVGENVDIIAIIFNTWKPLSKYIIDKVGACRVELWEDGVAYYSDIFSRRKFLLNTLAKYVHGHYRPKIFIRPYLPSEIKMRDRFLNGGIEFDRPDAGSGEKVFFGQPVVDDGICSMRMYSRVVESFTSRGYKYFAHYRERQKPKIEDSSIINTGLSAEKYIESYGCSSCASLFSTVNMNFKYKENIFAYKRAGIKAPGRKMEELAAMAGIDIVI